MHIAVAGNIGSGKTTLTRLLSQHYGWEPKYEDVDTHLSQHEAFTTYIASLMNDSSRGIKVDLEKLYEFLADWLVNHICSEDKKLAATISATPQ